MTDKSKIEAAAREMADRFMLLGMTSETMRFNFIEAFKAGHASRDEEVKALRSRVEELQDASHRTHDILDAVRANEEHLEGEVLALRAKLEAAEKRAAKWVEIGSKEGDLLESVGWRYHALCPTNADLILMVPPVPLPGEE